MSDDIKLEMAYTRYEQSCRVKGPGRECRRQPGHSGDHASDYPFVTWTEEAK